MEENRNEPVFVPRDQEEADRAAALIRICQAAERNKEEDEKRQGLDGS